MPSRAGGGTQQMVLMVRPYDAQRHPTQSWQFTHERRLQCKGYASHAAQAEAGRLLAGQSLELVSLSQAKFPVRVVFQ